MTARLVAVGVGIWLMVAPAVLDHSETAAGNARTFGPIIACLAFVAIWEVVRPLRWATLPFGAWMVVAPLAFGYDDWSVTANSIAAGLATLATAPLGSDVSRSFGGGWRSLLARRP